MDSTGKKMSLKPKKPVILDIEHIVSLKNPKLTLTLEDDDGNEDEGVKSTKPFQLLQGSHRKVQHCYLDQSYPKPTSNQTNCTNCDLLKHLLYLRDKTILNLAEDRDSVKIKLTEAMNLNIELSRQVVRFQKLLKLTQQQEQQKRGLFSKSNDKDVDYWRNRCQQMQQSNQVLAHDLLSIKSVLNELKPNFLNNINLNSINLDSDGENEELNFNKHKHKHRHKHKEHELTFIVEDKDEDKGVDDKKSKITGDDSVICDCDYVADDDDDHGSKHASIRHDSSLMKEKQTSGDDEQEDNSDDESSSSFDLWYNS